MALPNLHAPDDEWAEERVKRLMEPDKPLAPLRPGQEISAPRQMPPEELASAPALNEAEDASNPTSDDDIDEILNSSTEDAAKTAADPAVDKAVDEIMKTDGDDALKAQDKAAENNIVMKPKLWERLKNDFHDWWDNPRERYITLAILAALLIAVFSFPVSRTFVLNTVGFRSTVSLTVLDSTTNQPLKDVGVSLAGASGTSDSSGTVTLKHIHLGNQTLTVHKTAFAAQTESVYIGFGSTKLPSLSLKAVGTQFTLQLADYVSGKPVAGAEVTSGTASAKSDKTGKAVLTVQPTDKTMIAIAITSDGYRTEKQSISTTNPTHTVTPVLLVTSSKDVFVSKQSGKYDLYSADIDGKNRTVLLAATGTENQNISLSVNQDSSKAALVSTRDNQHDAGGYLLSTLSLVDVSSGALVTLEHSEQITLLGWSGTKIVYEQTVAGASAANPNRQRILSYDYTSAKRQQLASANQFNGFVLAGDSVYYSVSNTDPSSATGVYKIGTDGSAKQTITTQEVWTLLRASYTSLSLQTASGWLGYTVGVAGTKAITAPDSYVSRDYLNNSDASRSLWVDNRDGKGVLLYYDVSAGKDVTVTSQNGLTSPVRWLDATTVVYRVATPQETADYVVSTVAGSQPKKITDVTATN